MASDTPPTQFGIRLLCVDPFRVFFPLGILCGWIGASHWILYRAGWIAQYSGYYHGLIMIQGFQTCFIAGFLMTALPRFLEVRGPRPWEIGLGLVLILAGMAGLILQDPGIAVAGYGALFLHLLVFSGWRFLRRNDAPPEEFVFIGFGLLFGLSGTLMLLHPLAAQTGRAILEQGMPISFVMAISGFLAPRLLGYAKRQPAIEIQAPDGAAPSRKRRTRVPIYLTAGLLMAAGFLLEMGGRVVTGRLLRAIVVSAYFLLVLRVYRMPGRAMWHVRFLFLSFHFTMAGLWIHLLFPDYEIVALHLMFIGGFSLVTLSIATRVVVSHCGLEELWNRNLPAVIVLGAGILIALGLRAAADFWPEAYFGLLALASGFWLAGALAWGAFFLPKLRFPDTSE